jgi:hypothetical protein
MIGTICGASRFIRTKYRQYLRAGLQPRHALARAFHNLFSSH